MPISCGIDTGGTFTDCVVVADGRVVRAKVPSTPNDVSEGFYGAIEAAARKIDLSLDQLVSRLDQLVYGTTVATNIVVQRTGARVGLVTTRGFRDTLPMMRTIGRVIGVPPDRLLRVSATSKPEPIVRKHDILEVTERVDWKGDVVVPLDEEQCRQAVAALVERGVDAIAVAFLWSFVNADHERRACELVRDVAPDLYVTCSSDLAPKWGEYERTATAAINAYVGPATERYMRRVAARSGELAIRKPIQILQCGGGAIPIDEIRSDAVRTIGSGPAAGVIASAFLAERLGYENVICTDVGGTSFDVGLISDGKPVVTGTSVISQYRYFVPTIDVESIGAGGGSIASVDEVTGSLSVGPESAGAVPGPACYGRGGLRPTVTDACLVLGYYDPRYFLEGRLALDEAAARRAIATVAEPLDMSPDDAAAGIVRIAEAHMADLVRKTTIQRGYDPSDFALFAYGGAGPVHAGVYGAELGVRRIVVPLGDNSSLWSAFGASACDLLRVFERSYFADAPFAPDAVADQLARLEEQARDWLERQGIEPRRRALRRFADLKYKAQVNEVSVELPPGTLDDRELEALSERFERKYASLYGEGSGYAQAGISIVALRVEAFGLMPKPVLEAANGARTGMRPISGTREVFWTELGRRAPTPVYRGGDVPAGWSAEGPAIIEFPDTTLVVHHGQCVCADEFGDFELDPGGERA